MSATESKKYISLGQLARLVPSENGQGVCIQTVWRWSTRGCRGHKLAVYRSGGRVLTTLEDYHDFATKIAAGPAPAPGAAPARPGRRRVRNAGDVLVKAGIRQPAGV